MSWSIKNTIDISSVCRIIVTWKATLLQLQTNGHNPKEMAAILLENCGIKRAFFIPPSLLSSVRRKKARWSDWQCHVYVIHSIIHWAIYVQIHNIYIIFRLSHYVWYISFLQIQCSSILNVETCQHNLAKHSLISSARHVVDKIH